MKHMLIKLATYIFKKYNVTPILDNPNANPRLQFGNDIYAIIKLTITREYGCVPTLDIRCHHIFEVFDERISK